MASDSASGRVGTRCRAYVLADETGKRRQAVHHGDAELGLVVVEEVVHRLGEFDAIQASGELTTEALGELESEDAFDVIAIEGIGVGDDLSARIELVAFERPVNEVVSESDR